MSRRTGDDRRPVDQLSIAVLAWSARHPNQELTDDQFELDMQNYKNYSRNCHNGLSVTGRGGALGMLGDLSIDFKSKCGAARPRLRRRAAVCGYGTLSEKDHLRRSVFALLNGNLAE